MNMNVKHSIAQSSYGGSDSKTETNESLGAGFADVNDHIDANMSIAQQIKTYLLMRL